MLLFSRVVAHIVSSRWRKIFSFNCLIVLVVGSEMKYVVSNIYIFFYHDSCFTGLVPGVLLSRLLSFTSEKSYIWI